MVMMETMMLRLKMKSRINKSKLMIIMTTIPLLTTMKLASAIYLRYRWKPNLERGIIYTRETTKA